jgi:hypothetical protein
MNRPAQMCGAIFDPVNLIEQQIVSRRENALFAWEKVSVHRGGEIDLSGVDNPNNHRQIYLESQILHNECGGLNKFKPR